MTDSALWQAFLRFSRENSPAQRRVIVDQHPELLESRLPGLLLSQSAQFRQQGLGEAAEALERAADFFERCRRYGVGTAFAQDAAIPATWRRSLALVKSWLECSPSARTPQREIMEACMRLHVAARVGALSVDETNTVLVCGACLKLSHAFHHASAASMHEAYTELRDLAARAPRGSPLHGQACERAVAALAMLFDLAPARGGLDTLDRLVDSMGDAASPPSLWQSLAALRSGFAHMTQHGRSGGETHLRKALARMQTAISVPLDPLDAWNARNALASIHLKLHEMHGAAADVAAAIEHGECAWDQAPNEDLRHSSVVNLAGALCARFRLAGDASALERAIGKLRAALGFLTAGGTSWCSIAHNLGTALRLGGDAGLDEAVDLHSAAVEATPEADPQFALFAGGLANAHWQRFCRDMSPDELERAISVYERAIEHVPTAGMEQVRLLNNHAIALFSRFEMNRRLQDVDAAIQSTRRSLAALAQGAPAWADTMCNLGGYFTARYASSLQEADFEQGMRYLASAAGAMAHSPRLNKLQLTRATALLAHHRVRDDSAELDEAIVLMERILEAGPEPGLTGTCVATLAGALARRHLLNGDPDDATRAQTMFDACLSDDSHAGTYFHLSTALNLAHWSFDRAVRADQNADSADHHWEQAVRAFDLTGGLSEQALQLGLDRGHQQDLMRQLQGVGSRHAYACWKIGRVRRAIEVLEAGRARLLAQTLEVDGLSVDRLEAGGKAGLADRLRSALAALRVSKSLEARHEGSIKDALARGVSRSKLRLEIEKCIAEVRKVPGHSNFLKPMEAGEIQAAVGSKARLVYLLTTSAGGLALVVTSASVTGIELAFDLRDLRRMLMPESLGATEPSYLDAVVDGSSNQQAGIERAARLIGRGLIAPLLSHLQANAIDGSTPLYLVPSGTLAILPLHAATQHDSTPALIDLFTVSFLPSARILQRPPRPPHPRAGSMLVVGDPAGAGEREGLDGASCEAFAVQGLSIASTSLFTGESATAAAVQEAWADVETAHLACHGRFDLDDPLRSNLSLAGADELTLDRIFSSSMSRGGPRHVVMSACQTALSDVAHLPEETIGFPVALLQAGSETAVGTLWPVDDWSSSLLMARFTLARNCGESPARALAQAQRWLRDATREQLRTLARDVLACCPPPLAALSAEAFETVLASSSDDPPLRSPLHWAGFVCWGRA